MAKNAIAKLWNLALRSDGSRYSKSPITAPTLSAVVDSTSQITVTASGATSGLGTISAYLWYRDGALLSSTPSASPLVATGLAAGRQYSFTAMAVDSAGNLSAQSVAVLATTNASSDTTPPTVPGSFAASVISSSALRLVWLPSTDTGGSGVAGYLIERSLDGATGWTQIAQLGTVATYDDTGLLAATKYYYRARALDVAGNLSGYTGIINATTQALTTTFDFFIGPSGSDSNPGTQSQPWALTAINTKRSTYAGKKVGLLDGTYNLLTLLGTPQSGVGFDTNRLIVAGGTSASPTLIAAVNARQAVIDGARATIGTGVDWQHGLIGPGGDYVTLDGLLLTGSNYRTIVNYNGGGSFFTVRNCRFTNQSYITRPGSPGANSCMFYTQGHDDILVSNCRFEGGTSPSDGNRHAQVQSYYTTRRFTIEFSALIAEQGTGNLIYFKEGNNFTPIVRNCYLDRSASTNSTSQYVLAFDGQVTDTTDHAKFYNNILICGGNYTALYAAVYVGFCGTYDIYNNTFIGPWSGNGAWAHLDQGAPAQMNIYNNIWWRQSGDGGQYGDVNVYSIARLGTMDYNYLPSASPKWLVNNATSYTSLAAWQAASGKDAHSTTGSDPLFLLTGAEAARYKLQPTSPCKTLGAGGVETGAWGGGASRVGPDF